MDKVQISIVATVMAGYDGHRGWIYSMAVEPGAQCQGVGTRMMVEAEARLKALGCRKINLQFRTSNEAVLGFYESLGYHIEDQISLGKRL